jgi:hypothetical protein
MASPVCLPLDPVLGISVTPGTGTVDYAYPQQKQALARTDPGLVAAAYAQANANGTSVAAGMVANAKAANTLAVEANCEINARQSRVQAAQNQAAVREAVERANRAIAARNAQIAAALAKTTGRNLGDQPMPWWTWWWQDYNEMYHVSGPTGPDRPGKPQIDYEHDEEYIGGGPTYWPTTMVGTGPVTIYAHSCFAAGTKVWTLTGRQAIEKIKVGDRVLAQDVESGELAYKPVLAVTIRRPGPWKKLGLDAESLTATPSHPFWVAGRGWRMTKQLAAGSRVHTISGGVPVKTIESLEAEEVPGSLAYNLIVADYDDYFVGDGGVLVHDNTPRRPTAAILPGLTKQ